VGDLLQLRGKNLQHQSLGRGLSGAYLGRGVEHSGKGENNQKRPEKGGKVKGLSRRKRYSESRKQTNSCPDERNSCGLEHKSR